MKAVKYLKAMERMCQTYEECDDCPLCNKLCLVNFSNFIKNEEIEESVNIVEKWDKKHSIKTRQSEFLKLFPNAPIVNDLPDFLPCEVDMKLAYSPKDCNTCKYAGHDNCIKEYWLEEVKE